MLLNTQSCPCALLNLKTIKNKVFSYNLTTTIGSSKTCTLTESVRGAQDCCFRLLCLYHRRGVYALYTTERIRFSHSNGKQQFICCTLSGYAILQRDKSDVVELDPNQNLTFPIPFRLSLGFALRYPAKFLAYSYRDSRFTDGFKFSSIYPLYCDNEHFISNINW